MHEQAGVNSQGFSGVVIFRRWPGARIAEEIKSRTGWLIPGNRIVFSLHRNPEGAED